MIFGSLTMDMLLLLLEHDQTLSARAVFNRFFGAEKARSEFDAWVNHQHPLPEEVADYAKARLIDLGMLRPVSEADITTAIDYGDRGNSGDGW